MRSFGTEDRDAQCPMPPQNQIYDYILFRGSDIKDIQVLSNVGNNVSHNVGPLPHDPAIVQVIHSFTLHFYLSTYLFSYLVYLYYF